jgi:hypothetical protein
MSVFYGKRVYHKEEVDEKKEKVVEQKIDSGLLCFVRQRGNVLIKDFLYKRPKNLVHEQSELVISPIAMDPCIQYEIPANNSQEEEPGDYKPTLL